MKQFARHTKQCRVCGFVSQTKAEWKNHSIRQQVLHPETGEVVSERRFCPLIRTLRGPLTRRRA